MGEMRGVNNISFWNPPTGEEFHTNEIQRRDREIPSELWVKEEVWWNS